jgi:hypothetical protein
VCAKVIRYDWPTAWPDALSSLLANISQYNQMDTALLRMRALGIFHETLYQLSSKRLSGNRVQLGIPFVAHIILYGCCYGSHFHFILYDKFVGTAIVEMFPTFYATWTEMYTSFRQIFVTSTTQLLQALTTQTVPSESGEIQNTISMMKLSSMQLCIMTKILTLIISQFYIELLQVPEASLFLGGSGSSDTGDANFLSYYQFLIYFLQVVIIHYSYTRVSILSFTH